MSKEILVIESARLIDNPASSEKNWNSEKPDLATSKAPWCIYNIENNHPIQLLDYIKSLEKALGKKAKINLLPLQPGDLQNTHANVKNLMKQFDYKPNTMVIDGVTKFVDWYRKYYNL